MNKSELLELFQQVAEQTIAPEEGVEKALAQATGCDVPGLNLDLHRERRTGVGEVVFGQGKSDEHLVGAFKGLRKSGPVLGTKLSTAQGEMLLTHFPEGEFHAQSGLFALDLSMDMERRPQAAELMIVTAGSSDFPVALEALGSARFFGLDVGMTSDVGVAGLHRLTPHLENLRKSRLIIVCAGMEGALPSVLGGLVSCPIIAVPTSVGYGASFQGLAALLGMLNSCSPGLAVVNIDNGFGAAVLAKRLLAM